MSKLVVCAWLWGEKYGLDHVRKLRAGLLRQLKAPHRFHVVTDRAALFRDEAFTTVCIPEADRHLLSVKGCFARLRAFDPGWLESFGVFAGDRLVSMDLDSIVTGPLDPLFSRPDNFLILTGANAANPCPYNGSLWMVRAGYRPDVWSDFSLDAAAMVPHYEFPDDQAWFAHKLPGVTGWKVGTSSGVYAFQKPGWPKGEGLPADARLVVFPGWRDPSKFTHLPWVKANWVG